VIHHVGFVGAGWLMEARRGWVKVAVDGSEAEAEAD
jgi:hypothetical protein